MMQRALIHVDGPDGCGKTAFVEALLTAGDAPMIVGRCTRDASVRRIRESSPRHHAELRRYLRAGAWAAAVFTVPREDGNPVDFYESRLTLE
jgi:thymidylate kinase